MAADLPRMDLSRFEVADWGDESVVYDKNEFLTHLLPTDASRLLRDLVRSLGEGRSGAMGSHADFNDSDAALLLQSIGILSIPDAGDAVEPPPRRDKISASKRLPPDEPTG